MLISNSKIKQSGNHNLFSSPVHNELIGSLVVAGLIAARRLSPGRYRMTSARGFAFTAAMRMIDWVHGHAAIYRAAPHPALASRFADGDIFVIGIAYLADSRHAIDQHATGLARRQLEQRPISFLGHQLRSAAGRSHHLRAFPRLELDVVDRRA